VNEILISKNNALYKELKAKGYAVRRIQSDDSFIVYPVSSKEECYAAILFLAEYDFKIPLYLAVKEGDRKWPLGGKDNAFLTSLMRSDSVKEACYYFGCSHAHYYNIMKKLLRLLDLESTEQLILWAMINFWS